MAHFAEIGITGVVMRVVVIHNNELLDENGQESEAKGQEFCRNLFGGGTWVQTSFNANKRKNYAGPGYTYDSERDAFIPPKPFPSWTLNEETCTWEAPVPFPPDGVHDPIPQPGKIRYVWDEPVGAWVPATQE
jgi:hypothetical protein